MEYDENSHAFVEEKLELPESVSVQTSGDVPDERAVQPVTYVNQMGRTLGYGVLFWDEGVTDDYSQADKIYTNLKTIRDAIKKASDVAEERGAVLLEPTEWYY